MQAKSLLCRQVEESEDPFLVMAIWKSVLGQEQGICQEYLYMVHLFPSLLLFLFLSQPVLTDYTPFTLYLST